MSGNKIIRDLTQGNPMKLLISFSVPFILANLLQQMYNLADMMIVGRFVGSAGLAAASGGGELNMMFLYGAIAFSSGGQIVIAQHIGAGSTDRISKMIGTMFTSMLIMAAVFMTFALSCCDWMLGLLNITLRKDCDEAETLTAKKIPVVVMEPLLGGRLARYNWALAHELTPLDPEASLAKWALRFCASFDNVMTILSGMTFDEHISENIETLSRVKRCSEAEFAALERAAQALLDLKTIPCNTCNYCMPCPYGLDIPTILTFRNRIISEKTALSAAKVMRLYRETIPEELRRADHCTGCGRCSPHCPQSIDIPREIAGIDAWIDKLKVEAAL